MSIHEVASLLSVWRDALGAEKPAIVPETWPTTNGGVLLRWDEPHATGYSRHRVFIEHEKIPELCAELMSHYVAWQKSEAKKVADG